MLKLGKLMWTIYTIYTNEPWIQKCDILFYNTSLYWNGAKLIYFLLGIQKFTYSSNGSLTSWVSILII